MRRQRNPIQSGDFFDDRVARLFFLCNRRRKPEEAGFVDFGDIGGQVGATNLFFV
jgi:hypothetical protein